MQKRGVNMWHMKDFLAPTPSLSANPFSRLLTREMTFILFSFWDSLPKLAIPPTSYRGLSSPSGPGVPISVPESVPENGGVRQSVPRRRGVPGALWAPGSGVSKRCPESVFGASKKCPRHSGDTLGTLFGHSRARGPKGPGNTPWDTLPDTPVFGDTPRDTRPEGPERPL